LFDYEPTAPDELALKLGEIVTVTEKEEDGWWKGSTADGRSGVYPSNYVELIEDDAEDQNFGV